MATPVRDKRYTIPALSIDLFDKVYQTGLWSFSQFILKDVAVPLERGETFSGAFTFENRSSFGLFEAVAVKVDTQRKMMGAEFSWISKDGFALLEYMNTLRTEDSDRGPQMKVSLTYQTINWSFSGMLLSGYHGDHRPGENLRGMVRMEKSNESGVFNCTVIRGNKERNTLALKFAGIPPDTFALLEAAIKKQA